MTDGTQPPGTPGAPPAPPATAEEARAVLNTRMADKDWGARLTAGDAEATREWNTLQAKAAEPTDDVARAMAGHVDEHAAFLGGVPDSGVKLMANTAEMLREIGIRDSIIEETLRGHEVTAQEYKLVESWKARQMKDPVFVKAYLGGDPDARQKMTLAAIVLSGGIKGERMSNGF